MNNQISSNLEYTLKKVENKMSYIIIGLDYHRELYREKQIPQSHKQLIKLEKRQIAKKHREKKQQHFQYLYNLKKYLRTHGFEFSSSK